MLFFVGAGIGFFVNKIELSYPIAVLTWIGFCVVVGGIIAATEGQVHPREMETILMSNFIAITVGWLIGRGAWWARSKIRERRG